jgi:hypothetical protein
MRCIVKLEIELREREREREGERGEIERERERVGRCIPLIILGSLSQSFENSINVVLASS